MQAGHTGRKSHAICSHYRIAAGHSGLSQARHTRTGAACENDRPNCRWSMVRIVRDNMRDPSPCRGDLVRHAVGRLGCEKRLQKQRTRPSAEPGPL